MEIKAVSRRIEIAYKAEEADECAQHHEVRGCASTVNAAVVQLEFASLSGETCRTCVPATGSVGVSNGVDDAAGVSRGHSSSALERRRRSRRANPTGWSDRRERQRLNVRSGEAPAVVWNIQ